MSIKSHTVTVNLTEPKPPRQALEQYRADGYPEGLQIVVDAILNLYERIEDTHALASTTATHPALLRMG